ncbi:unnamed protein product [Vicia faba]|uniref:Uncharacterized protein n=1 Tax=Vicia faba TaxID=3906 RepID=A0AAV1ATP8_VICFA|nr:unnamed protein product [Vicia faba]
MSKLRQLLDILRQKLLRRRRNHRLLEFPPDLSFPNNDSTLENKPESHISLDTALTVKPLPTADTMLSQEELAIPEKTKPSDYLKIMMFTIGTSTNKCSSSSIVSGRVSSVEPLEDVLRQLRAKLLSVDLFNMLVTDSMFCYGLKGLLKKVYLLTVPHYILRFVVEFTPFLDQIIADIARKNDTLYKMQPKQ